MKRIRVYCWMPVMGLLWAAAGPMQAAGAATPGTNSSVITVSTVRSALTLCVGKDGRLYQVRYGSAGQHSARPGQFKRENEFYPQFGDGYVWEPALQATHVDGNTSTDLIYVRRNTQTIGTNITLTRIELKDGYYPFYVTLCLKSYRREDMIEEWAEMHHEEDGVVVLRRFASSAPVFAAGQYWLTQFCGDWGSEATMEEEKLGPGIKVLDSKLGVRASRYRIREVNLPAGVKSDLAMDGRVIDGATLMREGLVPSCREQSDSAVIELESR